MRRTPRVKCNERDRSPWAWDNPAFRYCPKRSESVIEFILRVHGSMGWRLPTQKALAIDGDLNIMLALSIPINCYGFRRVIKSLRGVYISWGVLPLMEPKWTRSVLGRLGCAPWRVGPPIAPRTMIKKKTCLWVMADFHGGVGAASLCFLDGSDPPP